MSESNMEAIALSIFPQMKNPTTCYVNMDDCAKRRKKQPARSPFLDADLTDRWLSRVHRKRNVSCSLGGYLEDRRVLWRGSYLKPDKAVHVAIDINVRADTLVTVKYPSRVVRIVHDPEQDGGWGGVVMLQLDQPIGRISHFLYAHLAKNSVKVREGFSVSPGQPIASIGRVHENGGWYEHLHVQAMTQQAWDLFGGDLSKFDGYSAQPAGTEHPYFPDPMPLL